MTTGQPDRISYSFGFKANGDNVHLSYSTDVGAGETPQQAMARAHAFVHSQCEEPAAPAEAAAPRREEPFDQRNRRHLIEAEVVFDELGIDSPKSRDWFVGTFLPGKPVARLKEIVQQERENFRQRGAGGRGPFKTRSSGGGRW